MGESIEFEWFTDDFNALLESCRFDDAVNLSIQYIPDKTSRILEAGCGTGRVVKFLNDRGYENVFGIELNKEVVRWINKEFPNLHVIAGDILNMEYSQNSFDVVLSYGVVEHFKQGIDCPLISLYNVLAPGGLAIITIPSFNTLRALKYRIGGVVDSLNPKRNQLLRRLFGQPGIMRPDNSKYLYHIYPRNGPFFEYRLSPAEFELACLAAGFEIEISLPISYIDGLYHEFGPPLVNFENWNFRVGSIGKLINQLLKHIPFFHNHMHACVLRKP